MALRRELLLFVEGLRTEELYLVDWHRRHRDQVGVTIHPFRGGPLQLVQRAAAAKKVEAAEARRGRGRAHDQIWCVFDRDEHPNVASAVDLAARHGINLAMSNPCIEVWFLLHFEDRTAFIGPGEAQSRAKALLGCSKVLNQAALDALADRYDEAKARAIRLDEKHRSDGSPAGSNPSSGLWRAVDQIRDA